MVWVNSTAPLQTGLEIKKIVNFFVKKKIDSLITVENKQIHCNFNNKPLNYIKNAKFARTQDLKKIQTFVYSLMIWKNKTFLKKYKKDKNAILCGKTFFYPVEGSSTIMIKKLEDLKLANYLIKSKSKKIGPATKKQIKSMLNLCIKNGVRNFIFASSCSIYGDGGGTNKKENHKTNPLTEYAKSKIYFENYCKKKNLKRTKVTCLRFGTAMGGSPIIRLDLVLNDLINLLARIRNIKEQRRKFFSSKSSIKKKKYKNKRVKIINFI